MTTDNAQLSASTINGIRRTVARWTPRAVDAFCDDIAPLVGPALSNPRAAAIFGVIQAACEARRALRRRR